MINEFLLIGRLVEKENIVIDDDYCTHITISPSDDKETIKVVLWSGLSSQNIDEILHQGDIVGVKGKLKTYENNLIAIAEKITVITDKGSGK